MEISWIFIKYFLSIVQFHTYFIETIQAHFKDNSATFKKSLQNHIGRVSLKGKTWFCLRKRQTICNVFFPVLVSRQFGVEFQIFALGSLRFSVTRTNTVKTQQTWLHGDHC